MNASHPATPETTAPPSFIRDAMPSAPDVNVGSIERIVSVAGGTLLMVGGLRNRSLLGMGLAAIGGGFIARGLTGRCALYHALDVNTAMDTAGTYEGKVFEATVTIDRPAHELYTLWRDLTNYPSFSRLVTSVVPVSPGRSRWSIEGPLGLKLEWDAEIINERPNELVAWRTTDGSPLTHAGSVRFRPAADGRGTEVHWTQSFDPPGGGVGEVAYNLLRMLPQSQAADELNRFKDWVESGRAPAAVQAGHTGQAT